MRLALQYLIASIIEAQPNGGKILLLLGEGPAGAVLRAEGERAQTAEHPHATRHRADATSMLLRRVRFAIAGRVLESTGASLAFANGGDDPVGFVLRIPLTSPTAETHLP